MKHVILKTMAAAFVVAGQMSAMEVTEVKEYSFLPGYVYGFNMNTNEYVSVGNNLKTVVAESYPPQYSYYFVYKRYLGKWPSMWRVMQESGKYDEVSCQQYAALKHLAPSRLGGEPISVADVSSAFYVIENKHKAHRVELVENRIRRGKREGGSFAPGYVYAFDGEKYVSVGQAKDVYHVILEGSFDRGEEYSYEGRSCQKCGVMEENGRNIDEECSFYIINRHGADQPQPLAVQKKQGAN